jgi:hypothetical protein
VKFNFSSPVNDVRVIIAGSGWGGDEDFTFTTDTGDGIPTLTEVFGCYVTSIIGNTLLQGGQAPGGQPSAGSIIKVSNDVDYTSITIVGGGGWAGSVIALCGEELCFEECSPILMKSINPNVLTPTVVLYNPLTQNSYEIVLPYINGGPFPPTGNNFLSSALAHSENKLFVCNVSFNNDTSNWYLLEWDITLCPLNVTYNRSYHQTVNGGVTSFRFGSNNLPGLFAVNDTLLLASLPINPPTLHEKIVFVSLLDNGTIDIGNTNTQQAINGESLVEVLDENINEEAGYMCDNMDTAVEIADMIREAIKKSL